MSFLAGRLAATEGAYFLQESKHAVGRLALKLPSPTKQPPPPAGGRPHDQDAADVLPEILRHSVPLKGTPEASEPTLTASKWALKGSSSPFPAVSPDVLNPLRAYVSLPQATFGPKRWQLPDEHPTFLASTANELRRDRYPSINPEKLKDVTSGFSQIGAAFALATTMVFGGAAIVVWQFQMDNIGDIRTRGKDLLLPGAEKVREQVGPLRTWAEKMSRKWHIEADGTTKEKSIIKELSKVLGARKTD
ncbi:hypothetical protein J5N97_005128 [Dioscorea zingiberensis]|uniref:Uncharacterized protein n=1 Tax=Dioscorea zingiberensis TaxID=325984 RepID=A0A9D5DA36_9LILI|nr:hypothetical protein J5N97_005128 [Dioscorea zingiberensis]